MLFSAVVHTFVQTHHMKNNELDVNLNIAALIGGSIVILTRFISIYFDLHLPKFKTQGK